MPLCLTLRKDNNSGFWTVNVTFQDTVQLNTTDYGTDSIFTDKIVISLVDRWGVILTVQSNINEPNVVWNPAGNSRAIDNLVNAFTTVENRLLARTSFSFKEVFGGLEVRFSGSLNLQNTIAAIVFNKNLVRFSGVTRRTTVNRLDNRSWGRINTVAGLDFYPSSTPYGFFNQDDKGIQNTVIHELGHVLGYRSTALNTEAGEFQLKIVKDVASANFDSTADIGIFWENYTQPLVERIADNFLNWVRNSYVGIENNIDNYNAAITPEQRRASAYWLGNTPFQLTPSLIVTSPGIGIFTSQAITSALSATTLALLRSLGAGEIDPNCTF